MTIWFTAPYGLGFRNVVCAGVVDACVDAGARARLFLPRLPEEDLAVLTPEIPRGCTVETLHGVSHGPWFTALKALKQHHYGIRTGLESFAIRRKRRRLQRPAVHAAVAPLERLGERLVPERLVDRALAWSGQPHAADYGRLMDRDRPDVIAVTKPGYMPDELPLIRAATRRRIPVIAIDTTWDNMASKRPPYLRPDRLTVWNAWMAQEAVLHYGFDRGAVTLTGGAQFDTLFRVDQVEPRASFLTRLGLNPDRRLIVFALNAPMYAPDNPGYLRLICEAISSGAITGSPNLLVRMHPFDRGDTYEAVLAPFANTRLERPFRLSTPGSVYECLPTRTEVAHYGSLMAHADVLINQASTTSLDAMATDTPVVNIAFDLEPTHPDASIKQVYRFSHYRRIVDSGAVALVETADSLFAMLSSYLTTPSLHREQRHAALRQFVSHHDAHAAERVAAAVMAR